MEYLNFRESVLNCPICRNTGLRRQSHYSKPYMKEFNKMMHRYMPVSAEPSHENLMRNRTILQKYMSYRDGYEQIHRKSFMNDAKEKEAKPKISNHKMKKHHTNTNMPTVIYQIYTLTTDNDHKPKKKSSRTLYSYPYSSSSSLSSTSFIGRKRKKSITMHPSTNKGSDGGDTDSEFDSCEKFPITEKHYRHIVDGIECSSHHKKPKPSSYARKKVTKRADVDFNQTSLKQSNPNPSNSYACKMKAKNKCNCKKKCEYNLKEETETSASESVLSEKTFAKFINSLHSYVNKTKKFSTRKYQKKIVDSDSSCNLCRHGETHMKKKKSSREKERDAKKHHHHHQSSHHKAD